MKGHRFSTSMKRAMISYTLPGVGRVTVQENDGRVDQPLRDAILKASRVFDLEYRLAHHINSHEAQQQPEVER